MKDNGPVDHAEYILSDEEVIITHTDASSHITYANAAFIRSSEFTLEECLGQPQNIVRHPDMPRQAFSDMWRTIRSGESWTGIIKNRRKNGGFYWVRANVTPIVEGGKIIGFMSVRVRPTRDEIRTAQSVYARLGAGRAGAITLRNGKVVDRSFTARLVSLLRPTLAVGNCIVVGAMAAVFGGIVIASLANSALATHILAVCGLTLALANLLYIHGRVVRPLQQLRIIASRIVSGDMRCRFEKNGDGDIDELATVLNQLSIKMNGVLRDTQQAIMSLRGSASDVVTANTELSNRTNEHAAGIEETAASLEQLTATVSRNTASAREATTLAVTASGVTVRGRNVVGEVVATISGISNAARKINDIVGIIDDIAFQTNLLALNAAVEAARAGEQGRGFAVVAQEVRHLAQRSASAAKEIKDLITASNETVEHGTHLAGQAEAAMTEVVSSVKRVAEVIAEIETASREQAAGIEQIHRAMTHMDDLTQHNAQMAHDLVSTAENLEVQSKQALTSVSAFSLQSHAVPAAASRNAHRGLPAPSAQRRAA